MHTHTFSLLGKDLYLTSYQRSCDVPLGLNFNQIQVYVMLALVAQITGNKPKKAYHKIINAHIYENQFELMKDVQLTRTPYPNPKLTINPKIRSLKDMKHGNQGTTLLLKVMSITMLLSYPFSV